MKPLFKEEKIVETIKQIQQSAFTVIDFIEVFKVLHPDDWKELVKRLVNSARNGDIL